MLIYTRLYRKYYPFVRSISIQTLVDPDLEKLIEYVRNFPSWMNAWTVRRTGCTNPRTDNLKAECEHLILKLEGRYALYTEEIQAVNLVLYAHRFNWILNGFVFPFANFDFDRYIDLQNHEIEQ